MIVCLDTVDTRHFVQKVGDTVVLVLWRRDREIVPHTAVVRVLVALEQSCMVAMCSRAVLAVGRVLPLRMPKVAVVGVAVLVRQDMHGSVVVLAMHLTRSTDTGLMNTSLTSM